MADVIWSVVNCRNCFLIPSNWIFLFSARELQAFLIYAKGRPGMIKGVSLDEPDSSEVLVPITSLTRPTTLDYDVRTQFIYYADIQRYSKMEDITFSALFILVKVAFCCC